MINSTQCKPYGCIISFIFKVLIILHDEYFMNKNIGMCVGNLPIGRIQEGKGKINNENKFNFCKTSKLSTTII